MAPQAQSKSRSRLQQAKAPTRGLSGAKRKGSCPGQEGAGGSTVLRRSLSFPVLAFSLGEPATEKRIQSDGRGLTPINDD